MSAPSMPARANLAEQVYQRLKAELHGFVLVPGDRLFEADVGQRLGVSRTPVREAMLRLRNEGLLEVTAKAGWFVRPLDFGKLDELYDLRITLELAAVQRLCTGDGIQPDSAPAFEALRAAWLVPAAARGRDARAVGQLDEQFHATLVDAAGNGEMARVHRDLTERIRIVRQLDFTRSDRVDATYVEHGAILQAVMQRKAGRARLLLRCHIEQSKVEVRRISLHAMHEARVRAAQPGGGQASLMPRVTSA